MSGWYATWVTRADQTDMGVSFTDCSGKTTRYAYDHRGDLVAATNALEQTTRLERLPTRQVKTVELPDGSQESFAYDPAGLLAVHHDRAGHAQHWQRNARGQVLQSSQALAKEAGQSGATEKQIGRASCRERVLMPV